MYTQGHSPLETEPLDQQSHCTFIRMGEGEKGSWAQIYFSAYLAWTHLRQKVLVCCIVLLPGEEVGIWIKNDFFVLKETTVRCTLASGYPSVANNGPSSRSFESQRAERMTTRWRTGPQNSSAHLCGLAMEAHSAMQVHLLENLGNTTFSVSLKVKNA